MDGDSENSDSDGDGRIIEGDDVRDDGCDNDCDSEDNDERDSHDDKGELLHLLMKLEGEEESSVSWDAEMEEEQASIHLASHNPRVCLASCH